MQRLLKTIGFASASTIAMLLGHDASAHAALLGDSVHGQLGVTGEAAFFNQTANVVDPGVEFAVAGLSGSTITIDVKDDAFDILFDLTSIVGLGAPFTWSLSDLNWLDSPKTIVSGLSLTAGDASLISSTSFTDDSVTVNFVNIRTPPASQEFSFDIQISDAAAIPTPALLPGLIGFGMSIVRKKHQQEVAA